MPVFRLYENQSQESQEESQEGSQEETQQNLDFSQANVIDIDCDAYTNGEKDDQNTLIVDVRLPICKNGYDILTCGDFTQVRNVKRVFEKYIDKLTTEINYVRALNDSIPEENNLIILADMDFDGFGLQDDRSIIEDLMQKHSFMKLDNSWCRCKSCVDHRKKYNAGEDLPSNEACEYHETTETTETTETANTVTGAVLQV